MSGYVPIGGGVGAGIVAGMVNVVAGPLFAQIERERRDGSRYVEAIRRARTMRELAALRWFGTPSGIFHESQPALERQNGIPAGWWAWRRWFGR
jgi:hypothetical protein